MSINVFCLCPSSPVAAFAARELGDYLGRMLPEGTELPVALSVEEGAGPADHDAFSVDMAPERGVIKGNSPRAVLLGVYDCLRVLGCRFLAPGRKNEVVPPITLDRLALHYRKRAAVCHRGVCIEGANSREDLMDFIDWMPKVGFNTFFLQFKSPYAFLERWYSHRLNSRRSPEPYSLQDAERDMASAEEAIARRGLLLHKVGHGWTGEVLGYKTLTWDPVDRPLAQERQYLAAQLHGVRGLYMDIPADTNLCLSEPDAVDRFAALVTQYARENPNVDYLHIWLADECNNVCECPACRQTTLSDQYVALLNEIDRRLTAEGLNTRLVFLLYQELLWPPVKERLLNQDRFVLMFAPISRTFETSYQWTGKGKIPPYRRNHVVLPEDLEENLAFYRGWKEWFKGDCFVYDYPLGRAHYGDLGYVHISRVIFDDVRRLGQLGLNGYVSCQELRAGMPNFLPNYIMGRALLDGNVTIEELLDEYFQAAYGEYAVYARPFLEDLSRLSCCDYVNGKGPRVDPETALKASKIRTRCYQFFLLRNELSEPRDPIPKAFWKRLRYHAVYAAELGAGLAALARGDRKESWERWEAVEDFVTLHEDTLQPWLDVYRLLEVTQKYTGFAPPKE